VNYRPLTRFETDACRRGSWWHNEAIPTESGRVTGSQSLIWIKPATTSRFIRQSKQIESDIGFYGKMDFPRGPLQNITRRLLDQSCEALYYTRSCAYINMHIRLCTPHFVVRVVSIIKPQFIPRTISDRIKAHISFGHSSHVCTNCWRGLVSRFGIFVKSNCTSLQNHHLRCPRL
jgi:hypothetical protein